MFNPYSSVFYQMAGKTRYMSWWLLSDRRPNLMRTCKIMVKVTSRTSRLKSDDFNIKGRPFSEKMCPNCDHGNIEDVKHILCQCPYNQREISEMYDDLYALQDGS